ncbi:hypothetical protein SAMN05216276_10624 [Streptosporangium subroseum]|uniref:Uncharacterized protein n=1 Tax=Streptosporangium subroseum TaxID=106412 RepID=A0A239NM86_9ACTN|nr:hypothetical protein [Streptosporangium subroseum]SNT55563.1 hypothetical protein SAMN05216276_10624 [Streptosporangium subroseum]
MVLIAFGNPSETTLRLLSQAVIAPNPRAREGTGAGAAWAARACQTAIDVLAGVDSLEDVLQRAKTDWG